MEWLQAFVLGVVQGLAEFLPVSSSGHLVLVQKILGVETDALLLDVLLHIGTVGAVLIVLWKDIVKIVRTDFWRFLLYLSIASVPAAVVGYVTQDWMNTFCADPNGWYLGSFFLCTALILWVSWRYGNGKTSLTRMNWVQALIMGLGQALAIFPGVSRSGTTLSAGLLAGMDRKGGAKFAMLMSVPIIIGSVLLEVKDLLEVGTVDFPVGPALLGVLAAAVSGILAIGLLLRLLQKGKLIWFSVYVGSLGTLILLDQLWWHLVF